MPLKAFIPSYYSPTWPLPMKYGAIGSIIAHEITHGFDSVSNTQWTVKEDLEVVKERQECLVKQYSQYGHYDHALEVTTKTSPIF